MRISPFLLMFGSISLAQGAGIQPATQVATQPLEPVPAYTVHRASSPIAIDGKVDEEAWKKAETIEFIFPWDKQTGAKQKTVARLLWDDQNLYVSYVCDDTDITALMEAHDSETYKDDCVEIFINPDETQNFYYGTEVNARGTLTDFFYCWPQLNLKRYDLVGAKVASNIDGTLNKSEDTDKGWSLELAIPWDNFKDLCKVLPPKVGDMWRANLSRWDGTEPDRRLSIWSDPALENPHPHNPARFGRLTFAE